MIGGHLIKSWSSIQPSITMSSGEAEMVGVTKAAAAALGFRSLMADLGLDWPVRVWTDSTASIGMCSRQGLGKVRHLDVQIMWIQQRVRNHDIDLYKVLGEENPADLMTKAGIPFDRIAHLIRLMGCEFQDGRPGSAPTLRTEGGTKAFAVLPKGGSGCYPGSGHDPNLRAGVAGTAVPVSSPFSTSRDKEVQGDRPLPVTSPFSTSRDKEVPAVSRDRVEAQALLSKWRDAETGDVLNALDIEYMATKVLGLPHQTLELARQYRMVPPNPFPEAQEPVDVLMEHGQEIGSAGEGRTPLPRVFSEPPAEGGRRDFGGNQELRGSPV